MISRPAPNNFGFMYVNTNNPSTTPGSSLSANATVNTEGTSVVMATAANLTTDIYGVYLWINAGNSSGAIRNFLLDLGVDPAGGTSYTYVVQNIQCGQSGAATLGGVHVWLPLFIKAGSQVACRVQGSAASATMRVQAKFYGRPSRPESVLSGTYSETIGTVTNSNGTSFTPGNSSSEGSWVSLGTTTRPLWYIVPTININNATTTSLMYHIDLAYGDGSNKHMIVENMIVYMGGTAETMNVMMLPPAEGYCDVPAGSTLYVRGTCSGTAVSGFTCLAVGIGG